MLVGVVLVRMRSSTNRRWVREAPLRLQPCPCVAHLEIIGERAHSRVATKSMPDSGAPCLEPRDTGTGCSVVQP